MKPYEYRVKVFFSFGNDNYAYFTDRDTAAFFCFNIYRNDNREPQLERYNPSKTEHLNRVIGWEEVDWRPFYLEAEPDAYIENLPIKEAPYAH